MLRAVGSDSSLVAAGQVNQAGGVASGQGRADFGNRGQTGLFDRTDSLQQLGLVPAAGEGKRAMVPGHILDEADALMGGLSASGFSVPLKEPITLGQYSQVNTLIRLNVIHRNQSAEVLVQSAGLVARQSSQLSIDAQATGRNASSASLTDPSAAGPSQARRDPSAAGPSQPRGEQPAAARAPGPQSVAGGVSSPQSGANGAGGSNGGRAVASVSAATTEAGRTRRAGTLNVEQGSGGVNPHEERRRVWARFAGSDYFPQRKLAYVFMGALGFSAWWAGEVMQAATVKMQDPKQPRSLLVTQMISPFIVFAVVMRIYLQMNKETKQDNQFAAMKDQMNTLAAGRDILREEPAARVVGPNNV